MTDPPPIEVVMVTAPGCHFCEDAARILQEVHTAVPLGVREVPLASEEGQELAIRHRAPFPPILIVGGVFFGHGRISRRKLEQRLDELTRAEATVE